MIPVVINADDFGLTEGVCAGIVKAIQAGGVTATTAMACVPGAVERLKRWAPKIPGHIGAHLQLTSGAPVLPPERVPSLVQDGGQFPAIRKQVRARTEEILFEWRAQIELLRCAGIELTHLDSHHHIHRLPAALPAFCELAKQYGLPARALDAETTRSLRTAGVPCVGRTLTDWYGGELSAGSLVNVLNEGRRDSPEAGSFEVMCHPGFVDGDLRLLSRYVDDREKELAVLCDGVFQRQLAVAGFALSPVSLAAGIVGSGSATKQAQGRTCLVGPRPSIPNPRLEPQ